MLEHLSNVGSVALLVFGFGFVVFWHELGHFLAAKAVGIKVEQFAVGFGNALLCWRKGLGVSVGSSAERFRGAIEAEWQKRQALNKEGADLGGSKDQATPYPDATAERRLAAELGLGETEYRLNYLPLGGYVKMLGQDDLDAASQVDDPRAYNKKSVGARMIVVCAGVVMNIILAALLFMGLFLWGYNVPPAIVGMVQPGSPAQAAGIKVGDKILEIDGTPISDATKVPLNVVLSHEGEALPVKVLRGNETLELRVTPRRSAPSGKDFLQMGVSFAPALRGLPPSAKLAVENPEKYIIASALAVQPGDLVVAVNGTPIPPELPKKDAQTPSSYATLDQAVQAADGKPVTLTLRSPDGRERNVAVQPQFVPSFASQDLDIAGVVPRPTIASVSKGSSAVDKLLPGDVLLSLQLDDGKDLVLATSAAIIAERVQDATKRHNPEITLTVLRDGKEVVVPSLVPNVDIGGWKKGLGIGFGRDLGSSAAASVVEHSPADRAGITAGSTIVSVGGKPTSNLFEFRRALLSAGNAPVEVVSESNGNVVKKTITLTDAELTGLRDMRLFLDVALDERIVPRVTSSPVVALRWGVAETRDLILQGYVTIRRMFEGSVAASNLSGPVGIFHLGGQIATSKSLDWTVWFLAMISANLAVVNFLPIPIVDGGLFVFLIVEKLMGRPLSPKAQGIAQIAGLALIAGVFLFVTYNDITHFF
jgi:regulator of sigma E protease